MIRNRNARLSFQMMYCILALIGFLDQLGILSGQLNRSYHVYYTALSNLLCMIFMIFSLVATMRCREDKVCAFAPGIKFVFLIMISITFILYNALLSRYTSVIAYFSSLKNGLNHCVLPILFVLDWFLFYERGKTKWTYPLLSAVPPFVYVVYILSRAEVLDSMGKKAAVVYPYYFLNLPNLGWGGFLGWMGVLLVAFLLLGYALCVLDHRLGRKIAVK